MYLQKLEIQGFKSFAQKTTLQFNRQLTAVVGPNGSGKSNIADAIRWVLGEQSLKLLRGKHSEDVIFAGSDKKNRSGLAEASIYLNNEDGRGPIDYSEIVITRRVYRDGQGEYLLNNKPVRLVDINLLLAQFNLGQKTYSVIGQGMIDSVLLSSPGERKEFFEEATGIKQYQLKREQSINKLMGTFDNLEQIELVLQEITPRLRSLTRQIKKLEQREELESNLTELQKNYFRYRLSKLIIQHTKVKEQQQTIQQKIDIAKKQVVELNKQVQNLEKSELVPATYTKLQQEYENERHQLNALLKQQSLAQAQEELAHIKKGEGEIAWLKKQQNELEYELKQEQTNLNLARQNLADVQIKLQAKLMEEKKIIQSWQTLSSAGHLPTEVGIELNHLSERFNNWLNKLAGVATLREITELTKQGKALNEELCLLGNRLTGKKTSANEQLIHDKEQLINILATLRTKEEILQQEIKNLELRLKKLTDQQRNITQALTGYRDLEDTKELNNKIKINQDKLDKLARDLAGWQQTAESTKQQFFDLQNELQKANSLLHSTEQEGYDLAITIARLDTKQEDLEREMSQELPPELALAIKQLGEIKELDEGETALEIQKLKHQLETTGGIEPEVIAEYQRTKERHDFLSNQEHDLKSAIASLEQIIQELDQTITQEFLTNFRAINEKFAKYFQLLFNGGKAELKLQKEINTDKESEEEIQEEGEEDKKLISQTAKEKFILQEKLKATMFSGVEIQATPPGKKLSSITALSGGEKALASIALICAIISHQPSPFVVLDEVDAALDEANSERFSAILENLGQQTQFITITHNRATMKRAHILYGVTMGDDGISRLLSVKLDEANAIAGKPKKK